MAEEYTETAWVDVLPSLKNFTPSIRKQLAGVMPAAGKLAGKEYSAGFTRSAVSGVEAASTQLAKARDKEADAAGRLRVAETKLQELRDSGKAKASQLAQAEENLHRAQRNLTDALGNTEAAHHKLTVEQGKAAKASDETAQSLQKVGREAPEASGGIDSITGNLGKLVAAAGGAAVVMDGFWQQVGAGQAGDKLAAQLALTADESEKAGSLAGKLYRDAYGESLASVHESVRVVMQNIGLDLNSVDLEPVTAKVLDLAATFDVDVGAASMAAGQLIKTGLAKDATEALDIVTAGFTAGNDKSGDWLETLNEYGTQFRKLGLDGAEATALISQGLQAGARDGDKVADALKEFSIRAIDGSKATAEGFDLIGMRGDIMGARIAAGGDSAKQALTETLDALRNIKDPVDRNAAAVALFGTQAEDLGDALWALDPASAGMLSVDGAAAQMGQTLNDNFGTRLEGWKRTAMGFVQDGLMAIADGFSTGQVTASGWQGMLQKVGIITRDVFTWLRDVGIPAISGFGRWVKDNASWLGPLAAGLAGAAMAIWTMHKATQAVTTVTKTWSTVQGLLNKAMKANPIILVVGLIAGLVAAFITAYKTSDTFRETVQAVWAKVSAGAQWMWTNVLQPVWEALKVAWRETSAGIAYAWENWIKPAWAAICDAASWMWNSVLKPAWAALQKAWQETCAGIVYAWQNWIKPAWDAICAAATWMWTTVLQPLFGFMLAYWSSIITGIVWAWSNLLKPAWDAICAAATWMWTSVLQPVFGFIAAYWSSVITGIGWAWSNLLKPTWDAVCAAAGWMWTSILKPTWDAIRTGWDALGTGISTIYNTIIKPVWDAFVSAIGWVKDTFQLGVDGIGTIWDGLKSMLSAPIQWVVDVVWNDGLRKLWNTISNLWGGDPIDPFQLAFADGGMMPGYTPGRDVHRFYSPTAGILDLSGGEPVLRPEAGRALGTRWVDGINDAARSGGVGGVVKWLSDGGQIATGARSGDAPSPRAMRHQAFAKGGKIEVPGWLSWIPGVDFVADVINAINGGGEGEGSWGSMVWGMVKKTVSNIWNKITSWLGFGDDADTNLGSSIAAGAGYGQALSWAKQQAGKPYIWGGVGPAGFDCSGFMSAITNVIRGRNPYARLGATATFPWSGFRPGKTGAFVIGSSPNTGGGIGHMAGTLLGTNVESRGGDGVVVGPRARGATSSMFYQHGVFDEGGLWPPGVTGFNDTGGFERVFTPQQDDYFRRFVDTAQAAPAGPRTVINDERKVYAHVDAAALAKAMRAEQRDAEFLYG